MNESIDHLEQMKAQEKIDALGEAQDVVYESEEDSQIAATALMRKQQCMLEKENVSAEEKGKVSLALFMMNMYMIRVVTTLPRPAGLLFVRLGIEQFRELIIAYNVGEN